MKDAAREQSVAKVTFLVPTLNRASTIVRAVESCLAAMDRAGWTGIVSVLDSESDDGSWQSLQERFGGEARVLLRQNGSGSGPTQSWLDAAQGTLNDIVTFVWSDDYISPNFLALLGPEVRDGAAVAIGVGAPRPINCTAILKSSNDHIRISAEQMLDRYCVGSPLTEWGSPVSPICALFRGDVFRVWAQEVKRLSTITSLRNEIMWRRAIGPDLLLFLIALSRQPNDRVYMSKAEVAHLSIHPSSITISSSTWILSLGYWLANVAFLTDSISECAIDEARRARYSGALLVRGAWLWWRAPRYDANAGQTCKRRQIASELCSLIHATKGHRKTQFFAMCRFLGSAISHRVRARVGSRHKKTQLRSDLHD